MQQILLCFLLIVSINVHSQEKKSTLLIFVSGYCAKDAPPFDPQLRVYRLPENTLAYKPSSFKKDSYYRWAEINDFIPGEYRIEYVNIFGQTLNCQYTKYKDPVDNRAAICYTETIPKYAPDFLGSMSDGDSVVLSVYSDGCRERWSQSLVVKRKKDKWQAFLYPEIAEVLADGSGQEDSAVLTIRLEDCKYYQLNSFINELRLIRPGGNSDTRHLYELRIGNSVETYIDDRGFWTGWTYLRDKLLRACPRFSSIMIGFEPE